MNGTEERYISLLTDFGFKRIFGTAPNKDLLINFLNSLFDGRKVIKDINQHLHVNMPILDAVYNILYNRIAPTIEVKLLSEAFR